MDKIAGKIVTRRSDGYVVGSTKFYTAAAAVKEIQKRFNDYLKGGTYRVYMYESDDLEGFLVFSKSGNGYLYEMVYEEKP